MGNYSDRYPSPGGGAFYDNIIVNNCIYNFASGSYNPSYPGFSVYVTGGFAQIYYMDVTAYYALTGQQYRRVKYLANKTAQIVYAYFECLGKYTNGQKFIFGDYVLDSTYYKTLQLFVSSDSSSSVAYYSEIPSSGDVGKFRCKTGTISSGDGKMYLKTGYSKSWTHIMPFVCPVDSSFPDIDGFLTTSELLAYGINPWQLKIPNLTNIYKRTTSFAVCESDGTDFYIKLSMDYPFGGVSDVVTSSYSLVSVTNISTSGVTTDDTSNWSVDSMTIGNDSGHNYVEVVLKNTTTSSYSSSLFKVVGNFKVVN